MLVFRVLLVSGLGLIDAASLQYDVETKEGCCGSCGDSCDPQRGLRGVDLAGEHPPGQPNNT